MTASGCVPCESLTKRTPSIIGDRLKAVLDAGEARRGAADRVGRDAEQQPTATAARALQMLWRAGQRELVERQDPAVRPGRRRAAAGQRQPLHIRPRRSSRRPRRARRARASRR